MKKRLGIISAILVVALAFVLTFALLASAEEVTEAQLVLTDESGTKQTLSGSYDEMAEELNAAIASLGAGTAELTLKANASATTAIVLPGAGVETVKINLAGYVLDVSAVEATPITVGGVKAFSLNGGYSDLAEVGAIVSTNAVCGIVELSASEQTSSYEIVDIDMTYAAVGAPAVLFEDDNELTLRNADIAYATDAADVAVQLVKAEAGELTVINSDIIDAKTGSGATVGVWAGGEATVRFENTKIAADVAYSMNGGTWLTAVDATFDAKTAVFAANAPTTDVVYCAGVTFIGEILGEGATADMIKLYYGTGSTLIDTDPTDKVTLASTLCEISATASGKWTLKPNSTSSAFLFTQIFDRGETTEKVGKFDVVTASTTVNEQKSVITVAFLKASTFSGLATNLFKESANGKTSTFLDFNGFTGKDTRAAHWVTANGLFRLSIDGADAEGNLGSFTHSGYAGGIIYITKSNAESVFTLRNIDTVNTNAAGRVRTTISSGKVENASSNMIQLQDSYVYMDNASFTYTGAEFARDIPADDATYTYATYYKTSQNMAMVYTQDAVVNAVNCRFVGAPAGQIVARNVKLESRAFSATTDPSKIYVRDCEFDGVGAAAHTTADKSGKIVISTSVAKNTTTEPFIGAGKTYILVSDCDITLSEGTNLASGKVTLLEGNKNMKIKTYDGSAPEGAHKLETGCVLYYDAVAEAYVIASGEDVTSVKLNSLFSSGMVFQAGKPINVWGTCDTDGATITVTLGDNSASATVADGKWRATLPAMEYTKGLTLTITESDKLIGDTKFKNVDIGEVWIFSGQSNSNLGIFKVEDFQEYKALADLYNIRCFSIAADLSETPLDEAKHAQWLQVTSSNIGRNDVDTGISAVGYIMATRLAVELEGNPTIAMVDLNYNGKAISNFISNEYDPYEGFSASYHNTHAESAHRIYNAMIAPFEGYNVKGFGWYQGEATYDSGECDNTTDGNYGLNVDQLYATFSKAFNGNAGNDPLELFIVQLSAYMSNPSSIRSYQQKIAESNEHYHLISSSWAGSTLSDKDFTLDSGDGFGYGHVHAARKSPLGLALADSILENVYFKDQDLKIANPEIESIVFEGNTVKVTIDRDITLMYGTSPEGFAISEDGTNWYAATGTIEGRTITLTASGVNAPLYVRYAFARSVVELESGEKIVFSKSEDGVTYSNDTGNTKPTTVTITANGKTYTFSANDTEVLRSMLPGNIVATNGHTLPVFSSGYKSSSAGLN